MDNNDTTAIPVLDRFAGAAELVRLSQRLMDWDEGPVSDEEIATALGSNLVDPFRYAQAKLKGRVRRVTLEPALCHSADVAIRAASVGYDEDVLMACLLHDVAEDTSSTIEALPGALDEIGYRFGRELANNVSLLSNRYQLLFSAVATKVSPRVAPEQRSLDAFRAALDVLRYESSPELVARFSTEFERVATFLSGDIDLSEAELVAQRDRSFTMAKWLERQLYPLYIEDMVQAAADFVRTTNGDRPIPLVVKSIDIIDNVRTSEVSNRMALYKLLRKAESVIDIVDREFLQVVPEALATSSTIAALHRAVQIRLVDQIKLRRRAVADNFSETRFASLVRFLADEAYRLTHKYRIPKNRVEKTDALEEEIRQLNEERRSADRS